jgi:trehalose 6-phosphate synthase
VRFSYRLNFALIAGAALTSLGFALYQHNTETRALKAEVQRHSLALAESLEKPAEPMVVAHAIDELHRFVDKLPGRGSLAGIAIYDAAGEPLAITRSLAARVLQPPRSVLRAIPAARAAGEFTRIGDRPFHVLAEPLRRDAVVIGALAVFEDVGYIDARGAAVWRSAAMHIAVQTFFIVCITLLCIHLSLSRPLRHMTQWLRDLRTGRASVTPSLPTEEAFKPVAREFERMASSLTAARAAAHEEARLRDAAESQWTLERLRVHVQNRLEGSRLFVVSNREPYEHRFRGDKIECSVPASGLVTALEPVLSACGGTWVAQATGDADRESVDAHHRVAVPPETPRYTLRRVWLSEEEERGFYFGFANEGLWPLCHIAHTRPIFRAEDWEQYRAVNRKFADALLEEIGDERNPIVLVQDYHFALLPRMIKQRLPGAHVAVFWHIPWPNPEAFGICPWQHELLDGILGADLVGFHIQAHCNNFLETVDRAIECRIERERFAVNRLGHVTSVRPIPISVAASPPATAMEFDFDARRSILEKHGLEASTFGIGVDRVDYTKGIPERFRALERLFEVYPKYRKQLTFIQIGSPSRTPIRRYQDLMEEVRMEADRINRRFHSGRWKPILLIARQHSHAEILPYYRAASVCLVTSLHDGMNLVAKEFVAAREDDDGVLVLSRFAGATHELSDALTVNPYDTVQLAEAIQLALEMHPEERASRMRRMRTVVREHNIYRWAGTLVSELSEIRLPASMPGMALAASGKL